MTQEMLRRIKAAARAVYLPMTEKSEGGVTGVKYGYVLLTVDSAVGTRKPRIVFSEATGRVSEALSGESRGGLRKDRNSTPLTRLGHSTFQQSVCLGSSKYGCLDTIP